MDENKLKKLKDLSYTVRRTCGNCKNVKAQMGYNGFTTCIIHKYEHLKHSDRKRELSVHIFGVCEDHEWREDFDGYIHAYVELKENARKT